MLPASDAGAIPPVCARGGDGIVTLATATSPGGLAVDATDAYFTQLDLDTTPDAPTYGIMKVPLCGGTPITLATSVVYTGLAIDATNVYWVEQPATGEGASRLDRVPKVGGPVTALVSLGTYGWSGPVLDSTSAYLTGSTVVVRVPLDGGAPVTLASHQNQPGALVVDATYVYWLNEGDGSLAKTPVAGGPVTTLVAGESGRGALVLGGSTLFWNNDLGGDVRSIPVDGGVAQTVVPGQLQIDGLAIDATTLYLSSRLGLVESVPLAGGSPATLYAQIDYGLGNLVVDATSLYWTDMSSVVRLTPK